MGISLDGVEVDDFIIDSKSVTCIMLDGKKIWPTGINTENQIELDIIRDSWEVNNKYITIENIECWDENFNLITFNKLERVGNPNPLENPLEYEAVFSNNNTRASINHNFGLYHFYGQAVPEEIAPRNDEYNYAYAWLPKNVRKPHNNANYIGYTYMASYHNLPAGTYKVKFNSDGNVPVKYLGLTFGYSPQGPHNITSGPYRVKFKDKYVINYTNENTLKTLGNEWIYGYKGQTNYTWKARYVLGTDGSINKYWARTYYSNSQEYIDDIYLIRIYEWTDPTNPSKKIYLPDTFEHANSNSLWNYIEMVKVTIEDVIMYSDGKGKLIINMDSQYPPIKISTIRGNVDSPNPRHSLNTMLVYDNELNLINTSNLETKKVLNYIPANTTHGIMYSIVTRQNYTTDVDYKLADKFFCFYRYQGKLYYPSYPQQHSDVSAMGIYDRAGWDNGTFQCNLGITDGSMGNRNSSVDRYMYTNYNIRMIAISLQEVYAGLGSSFTNILKINDKTICDTGNNNPSNLKDEVIKLMDNTVWCRRYFLDMKTDRIYVSYIQMGLSNSTHTKFRDIYVYDRCEKIMTKIDLPELMTGKYPGGQYNDDSKVYEDKYKYEFTFKHSFNGSLLNYGDFHGLDILRKNGTRVGTKTQVIKNVYFNGEVQYDCIGVFKLSNGENVTVLAPEGVHNGSYSLNNIWNNDKAGLLRFITAYKPENQETKDLPRKFTFYLDSPDHFMLFIPYYWTGDVSYTWKKMIYHNNNDQIVKDFGNTPFADIQKIEMRTVKTLKYCRKVLLSYTKAYLVFTYEGHRYAPLYKYCPEYDEMIEFTIDEIVEQDLVSEIINIEKVEEIKGFNYIQEFYFKLRWPQSLYNYNSYNYLPIRHGLIYIDDGKGGFKYVNPDNYTKYAYTRFTKFGANENDYTSKVTFKDKDDNVYEIATDAGTYNDSEYYHLFNIFSRINFNKSTNINYGYLSLSGPNVNRWFKFNFRSTVTIKAMCLCFIYQDGNRYPYSEIIRHGKYKESMIFDYHDAASARDGHKKEDYYARFIFFPDKTTEDHMKVFTPLLGNTNTTSHLATGHFLWNRRTYKYDEFTIEELYNFDRDRYKYRYEDGSYEIPDEYVNKFEFYGGISFSEYSDNTYGTTGNWLLLDDNNDIINLTFVEESRNVKQDTPFGENYHTTKWVDDRGNEFILKQNGFWNFKQNHVTYGKPYVILTPRTNIAINQNNSAYGQYDYWLTRDDLKSTINGSTGKPNKLVHMIIMGKTRRIKAIAISEAISHSWGSGWTSYYQCSFTHFYYKKPDGTDLIIRAKTDLATLRADWLFIINNKQWAKRRIILEDGTVIITWMWYGRLTRETL